MFFTLYVEGVTKLCIEGTMGQKGMVWPWEMGHSQMVDMENGHDKDNHLSYWNVTCLQSLLITRKSDPLKNIEKVNL